MFRLYANKVTMPRVSGLGQYRIGRVSKEMFKHANAPIEFQTNTYDNYEMEEGIIEKRASFLDNPITQGAGMALGAGLASLAIAGVGKGIDSVGNIMDQNKYDEALRTAIQMSPTLQRYGFNNLKGFMPMIIKASPTVAEEPRLLANYLESMIDAEGHLNMATFSELANIENTVLKNNEMRNNTFGRNLAMDFGEGFGTQLGKGLHNAAANRIARAYADASRSNG